MTSRSEQDHPQIPQEQLQNGYSIVTADGYYYSYPLGDIAYDVEYHYVFSPNDKQTGIHLEMVKESRYSNHVNYRPLTIGWDRKFHLEEVAAAIDTYFQNSSTKEYANTEVAGDYTEGDIIWGQAQSKKVDKQFLEEIIKNVKSVPLDEDDPLEFETIGRILFYATSGSVKLKGDTISVSPYFATKEQIEVNKNAIRRLFEATSNDNSLIPVFDEVLDKGFENAEKKVNEWMQNSRGDDTPFNP